MERPDIFGYLDYRPFLDHFFKYLATVDSKYSRRWVSKKAGLKSPQLISMILKGERKLSAVNAQLLAMALHLSEKEEEYLLVLIELENASHHERQMEILDRIRFQFQNGLFRDLPDSGFEYIKKWFYSATRELTAVNNFSFTANSIAQALSITPYEAEEAMDFLLKLGFLNKNGDLFERSEPSVRASDYVSPLIMAQFHFQLLERAFQAVQLARDIRHFDSLIVALSHRDFELVREKIRQFIREVDMLAEASAKREDVFQLSIQFFSLTGGRTKEVRK